jgi:hypothetical protein
MDRGEVGDKRGSKEMDRCPLTMIRAYHIATMIRAYHIATMMEVH